MSWIIELPVTRPLSLNDREHWATKARRVRELRDAVTTLARAAGIPHMTRAGIELNYSPRDRRRRDALNLTATLKVCEDAIVAAGVIDDDCEPYLTSRMPQLAPPNGKRGRLWLVVWDDSGPCTRCGGEGAVDAEFCMVTCPRCHGDGGA